MDWEARGAAALILCLGILLATTPDGSAEQRIVCYYTNWSVYRPGTAKFSPQNINPYLCTHLIYAFGGFTKDNALKPFDKYQDIEKGGYAKFNGLKTYNKNLKTMLAIGGWNEGSSRFSPMVADAKRRREFVKNSIKFLRQNHFDGLDLDWEYPAFRDGGKPRDKDNYASLVQELREEFERESSKTGRPRLLLSMAMPAGASYIDKGYDVPKLDEYLDFINLLSYDYHSAYEPAVNHHSPLYALEEDSEYSYDNELTIDYTINYLLKKGASAEKIVLGIPTYGRSYTLFNEDATELGSPADGPGEEGEATREKGYLAYYEICENLSESDDWEVIEPNPKAMGPYAFKGNQWVGYDDEGIVRKKAKYVNEKNLGGIMFWSIDNDDFRGKCHGRPYPLIEAAKEALLSSSEKAKAAESRKKNRPSGIQSNAIARKLAGGRRTTTTTSAPISRKRVSTPRPKFRTRGRVSEEEDEEDDREMDRRSYQSVQEEEEDNNAAGNAVRSVEKNRSKAKGGARLRGSGERNRRKQSRRKEAESSAPEPEESLGNKLTTPEPPTTPDPGTDFKCEDEGFFPHPRDCKKYFWCLDSGPGGLGVVAHQFTCPSGLVFNKAADSCDYPRNVVCPKAKSVASTTRAPITAATSRTTYLHSTTRRTTTAKAESEEEYEYYDEEEEEEVTEKPRSTTTSKPLLYKTINRNKPATTTTTTTTPGPSSTSRYQHTEDEKNSDTEDEEDPRVIKELIDLIRKAGGIEQLEKQLLFQDRSSDAPASQQVTPATISRTLYERVLSRQAIKSAGSQRKPAPQTYGNGPGGSQFEGLEDVPEVKTLRRSQKPQYVTIERQRPSTPPVDEEEDDEEDEDDDNTDVASSEERTIHNRFLSSSTQRATPNYVNIRRNRPSTTTVRTENDVDEREDDSEEEIPVRRRRPSSKSPEEDADEPVSRVHETSEESPTTKSRYVNIQRFRSTTSKPAEDVQDQVETTSASRPETTESTISTRSTSTEVSESSTITVLPSTLSSVTSSISTEITKAIVNIKTSEITPVTELNPTSTSSTTEPVNLVEDSATEILLTTTSVQTPKPSSSPFTRNQSATTAAVSQPRPFGFPRRTRPTLGESSTTPIAPSKVAISQGRLPTLRELVDNRASVDQATPSTVLDLLDHSNEIDDLQATENDALQARENDTLEREEIRLSDHRPKTEDRLTINHLDYDATNELRENYTSKKRRTSMEHLGTTDVEITTRRGSPLTSRQPSWYYITKDDFATTEMPVVTEDSTDSTVLPTETATESTGETVTMTVASTLKDSESESTSVDAPKVTPSFTERSQVTTVVTDDSTLLDDVSNASSIGNVETTPIGLMEVPVTRASSTESTVDLETRTTEVPTSTESESSMTAAPKGTTSTTQSVITEASRIDRRRERVQSSAGARRFGQKVSRRPTSRNYFTELRETSDRRALDEGRRRADQLRRRLPGSRGRHRYHSSSSTATPITTTESTKEYPKEISSPRGTSTSTPIATTESIKEYPEEIASPRGTSTATPITSTESTKEYPEEIARPRATSTATPIATTESTKEHPEEIASPRATSTSTGEYPEEISSPRATSTSAPITTTGSTKEHPEGIASPPTLAPTIKSTSIPDEATSRQTEQPAGQTEMISPDRTTETRDVHEDEAAGPLEPTMTPEVTTLKSTRITSRTSALSTRLRKVSTTVAPSREPPHANLRRKPLPDTKIPAKEVIIVTEEPKWTESVEKPGVTDQSSRAQEIAVTLTDPPPSQAPSTGRLPVRATPTPRRKISTTVTPRVETTTTARPIVRFRGRQKERTKEKSPANVTVRPRRPAIVDYDYYEDELEPIVHKSTLGSKLFLTNKGTIRCLDQGNFPHPYSCNKFITCARMVNGLVVGAEYTCPDKLSFDPIGGICNWSAGLGCKE